MVGEEFMVPSYSTVAEKALGACPPDPSTQMPTVYVCPTVTVWVASTLAQAPPAVLASMLI
jgi:hypothetical protein